MTSISQAIRHAVLSMVALCALFVGVVGCPATGTLTISYSWPPSSLVHIVNSGVPGAAVTSGIGGWNTMNALYECFGPTFIADNNAGSEQINMSFTSLPVDPATGLTTRGRTQLDSATFILGRMVEVNVQINSSMTVNSTIAEVVAHELGHTQALWDCVQCGLHSSVMEVGDTVTSINTSVGLTTPTICDIEKVESVVTDYKCPPPPPGGCNGEPDFTVYVSTGCMSGFTVSGGFCTRSEQFQNRCAEPSGYDSESCTCPDGVDTSPIVIDVKGTGFFMTDTVYGVSFNILDDGVPLQMSWTNSNSGNAFLVLDRNGNGLIDNGSELFGNLTPQPSASKPNGFRALAVYDQPANGGNGNGRIDGGDAIFSALRLWQDSNHNGSSEPTELEGLSGLLSAIDLDYRESRRIDQYGNQFRYRSKVFDLNGAHAGKWAWDVFLKAQ